MNVFDVTKAPYEAPRWPGGKAAMIDASGAIQWAIEDAAGRPVYLPAGTYIIENTLDYVTTAGEPFTGGLNLYGDGSEQTILLNKVASGALLRIDTTMAFTVDETTDRVNLNDHGFTDGTIIRVASAGTVPDTLPGGLSANTDYSVIGPTTNDFQLSTSQGGSAINITSIGKGTHRVVSPSAKPGENDIQRGVNLRGFSIESPPPLQPTAMASTCVECITCTWRMSASKG
jgi:hypothetical protein